MTRRALIRRVLLPGLVVLAVAASGAVVTALSGPPPALAGGPAPTLTGADLDGGHQDLADRRGQVVLVNIWASWCAPCAEEIPMLLEAQQRYAGDGLVILGIATQDRPAAAARAAIEWGADAYPSVRDEDGKLAVSWGSRGVPETFIVDRDGVVVDRHIGPVTARWLNERLAPVMRP